MTTWLLLLAFALAQDEDPKDAAAEEPASEVSSDASSDEAPAEGDAPSGDAPPDAPAKPVDFDGDEDAQGFDDDDADYVITVVSQVEVRAARDEVVRSMKELGWKARRRRDGIVIFRGPEGWMGKARLYDSGDLEFTTPAIAFGGPRQTGGSYDSQRAQDNDQQSGTVGINTTPLPGPKKVRAAQEEIRAAVQPLVLEYREKIQAAHFTDYIGSLPDKLDLLWERGEPVYGFDPLKTWEAKRKDALDFWATRLDTPEGTVVSKTVEVWLRRVVMDSEHPVTPAEKAEAEAKRADARLLDLGD